MKKIQSLFKKTQMQYFVLGVALSFVISFGVSNVIAENNSAYQFISSGNTLENRIGSLSVNQKGSASWINPALYDSAQKDAKIIGPREECITTYIGKNKNEIESCLDVNGIAGFSKLTVLDIPAFFINSLYLNSDGSGGTLYGIPEGLIIEDFPGEDDSIMASSLQYTIPDNAKSKDAKVTDITIKDIRGGIFSPRDFTTTRELCAYADTGILYPCGVTLTPIAGACVSYTETYASQPAVNTANACTAGSFNEMTDNATHFLWECAGVDGGANIICQAEKATYSCQGAVPADADPCSGDTTNLTSDVNYSVVDSCGTPKCEYTCKPGFHKDANSCIADVTETYSWYVSPTWGQCIANGNCLGSVDAASTSSYCAGPSGGQDASFPDSCIHIYKEKQPACDADPRCSWTSITSASCGDLETETSCNNGGCTWDGGTGAYQYRSVYCQRDSDGARMSGSLVNGQIVWPCDGSMPAIKQSCVVIGDPIDNPYFRRVCNGGSWSTSGSCSTLTDTSTLDPSSANYRYNGESVCVSNELDPHHCLCAGDPNDPIQAC